MMELRFYLEERSAEEMLKGLLPKILPENIKFSFHVFEGKPDLMKNIYTYLKDWKKSNTKFVIILDQDNDDCMEIKERLLKICNKARKPETLIRIVCQELESFYLGDLKAVEQAMDLKNLSRHQNKFRNPDQLKKPSRRFKNLTHDEYQKISSSRAIGLLLNPEKNHSKSFINLVQGVQKLTGNSV